MEEEIENKDLIDEVNKDKKAVIILIIFVVFLWIIIGFLPFYITPEWTKRGQLGDMFGVVNSLFSGLAFAGVIYTIFLQRKELSLQRKELKDTRTVFQTQSSIMKLQQRENVFFQMLENHRGIVNSLNQRDSVSYSSTRNGTDKTTLQLTGHEVIEKIVNPNLIESLINLNNIILLKSGDASNYLYCHPMKTMRRINDLDHISKSIIFIINFILEQLNNDEIYHKILYNALSRNEKILLGIFLNFNFDSKKNELEKSNFNYLYDFYSLGFKKIEFIDTPHFQYELEKEKSNTKEVLEKNLFRNLKITNISEFNFEVNEITSSTEGLEVKIFQDYYNIELVRNIPSIISLDSYFNYLIINDDKFKMLLNKEQDKYECKFELNFTFKKMSFTASFKLNAFWLKSSSLETLQFTIR